MQLGRFYRSTIGKKLVMALTGLILVGFVIAHMTGNLLVFSGAEAINGYAAKLRTIPAALWGLRAVLLVAVILHVVSATQLTQQMRRARPVGYHSRDPQVSTWGARTIRIGGFLLLAFIIYHVLHFTTGDAHPSFVHGDVYGNLTRAFSSPLIATIYLVAMLALALHLYHGVASVVQTLGVTHAALSPRRKALAALLALVVSIGFALVPLAIITGWLGGR